MLLEIGGNDMNSFGVGVIGGLTYRVYKDLIAQNIDIAVDMAIALFNKETDDDRTRSNCMISAWCS